MTKKTSSSPLSTSNIYMYVTYGNGGSFNNTNRGIGNIGAPVICMPQNSVNYLSYYKQS